MPDTEPLPFFRFDDDNASGMCDSRAGFLQRIGLKTEDFMKGKALFSGDGKKAGVRDNFPDLFLIRKRGFRRKVHA